MEWDVSMKRVISLLKNIRLRQIVTIFLLILTFLVGTTFVPHANQLQAQASQATTEKANYDSETSDAIIRTRMERVKEDEEKAAKLLEEEGIKVTNRAAESAKDPNKNLFESIKEKLNLDEPIDPGTKEFVEETKEAASEALSLPSGR